MWNFDETERSKFSITENSNEKSADQNEADGGYGSAGVLSSEDSVGSDLGGSSSGMLRKGGRKPRENSTTLQAKWEEMFARLVQFRKNHGHCLVPNRYSEDPQLGSWVSTQRRQYKILTSGGCESTPMTPERASKLMSIGFEWATKDPRHVPWETRYTELIKFVEIYGHAQVPIGWEENVQLSNWVSTQRQEYKLLRKGRSSRLTNERIKMLNDVGFVWEAQRGGPRRRRKSNTSVNSSESASAHLSASAEVESDITTDAANAATSLVTNQQQAPPATVNQGANMHSRGYLQSSSLQPVTQKMSLRALQHKEQIARNLAASGNPSTAGMDVRPVASNWPPHLRQTYPPSLLDRSNAWRFITPEGLPVPVPPWHMGALPPGCAFTGAGGLPPRVPPGLAVPSHYPLGASQAMSMNPERVEIPSGARRLSPAVPGATMPLEKADSMPAGATDNVGTKQALEETMPKRKRNSKRKEDSKEKKEKADHRPRKVARNDSDYSPTSRETLSGLTTERFTQRSEVEEEPASPPKKAIIGLLGSESRSRQWLSNTSSLMNPPWNGSRSFGGES